MIAMGFNEREARHALQQTPNLSAAVEYLMVGGAAAGGGLHRAATGLYGAAGNLYSERLQPLGGQLQPAAASLYSEHLQPAAENLYGAAIQPAAKGIYFGASSLVEAVGSLGSHLQSLVSYQQPAETASDAEVPCESLGSTTTSVGQVNATPAADVEATLQMLGFSSEQAQAAARRCSSVEAAIEWIDANPHIEH